MERLVLIVGRPNVGKSSLFNRLIGRRTAVVDSTAGVTRDRIHGTFEYGGKKIEIVDTGGVGIAMPFGDEIKEQITKVLPAVGVILFVVDAKEGITSTDIEIADWLRKLKKPIIVVANKVDNLKEEYNASEFYELGLGEPIPISATHGRNIYELLEQIVLFLPEETEEKEKKETVKVAIVGRPNVGKSSLFNYMIGDKRAIVTDIPGTTRDTIDTLIERDGNRFLMLDTAGLRRRSRPKTNVEYYSTQRTINAITTADICLVLIDAVEGFTNQDRKIISLVEKASKATIIVFNKWDMFEEDPSIEERFKKFFRKKVPYLKWAPLHFTSAISGYGINKLWDKIATVYENYSRRIPTSKLNIWLKDAMFSHAPEVIKGKRLKIFYATQVEVRPPTVVFFVNDTELLTRNYRDYMLNRFRYSFEFAGSPIIFKWKLRQRKDF